ncbi:MAG: hypothetical protein JJU28_10050 [Cyclobacteriaceae bacterium]|nr:hypothetical protein [Cyclobacteriaceae bacterium]
MEQENENGIAVRQITLHPVTGIPIAFHTASGTHYSLFDSRFNLIALLNDNGNLLENYRYNSFGQPSITDNTGTSIPNSNIGIQPVFGGQRLLSVSKLYLSKKRLMNPENGSFLSADLKGYVDSASLYIYSGQDPINNIDPNGEVIPFIVAAFVIGGALGGAGYSAYDAYHNPNKYEGWSGTARIFGNVFGGAAIGGLAIVGGELVLAAGGTGIFATGTATTLTASQTFILYGTAAATTGAIGRTGFNSLFPDYIDPVSAGTIATDFALGGALPVVAPIVRQAAGPVMSGVSQMFSRAVGGNWRAFGSTMTLLRKGYSSSSRLQYGIERLFWNNRSFSSVSNQYWSQSVGRANGKALHHLFFQNQTQWIPRGIRNAGFNLLEIPGPLNTWMGGRFGREVAFRGLISTLLAGTGYGSYKLTDSLLNNNESGFQSERSADLEAAYIHPNEKPHSSK